MVSKEKVPGEKSMYGISLQDFTHVLIFSERKTVTLAICACSYYRLYINGTMEAHGPARTAKGYGRSGRAYPGFRAGGRKLPWNGWQPIISPDRYSNTISLDPGMFICEITCGKDILSATGVDGFPCALEGMRAFLPPGKCRAYVPQPGDHGRCTT